MLLSFGATLTLIPIWNSLSLSLFFSHVAFSLGDGISYPIQMMDEDAATLLGNNYVDATDSGTENLEF